MQFQFFLFSDRFHGFRFAGMLVKKNDVPKSLHVRLEGYNRIATIELTVERLYLMNGSPISNIFGY